MNHGALLRTLGDISLDALEVLAQSLTPWRAAEYCLRCGVPPLTIPTDWATGVTALRAQRDNVDAAEYVARLLRIIDSLVDAVAPLYTPAADVLPTVPTEGEP